MLAMPAAESMRAKLFSAAADSSGVPSSKSWSPETARSTPASFSVPVPRAVRSSDQAVSYCFLVRGWPKSYIRANLSRMLRLRMKARAAAGRMLGFVTYMWGYAKPRLYIQVWGEEAAGTMVRVSCLVLTNILQSWWERGTGTKSGGWGAVQPGL